MFVADSYFINRKCFDQTVVTLLSDYHHLRHRVNDN